MILAKKQVKTRYYIALSTVLHILLFVWMTGLPGNYLSDEANGEYPEDGVNEQMGDNKKIVNRPVEIEIVTPLEDAEDGDQANSGKKENCLSWFGGVGVMISPEGLIYVVYSGYPAEKAGIQVGDIVRGNGYGRLIGEVGTPVDIEIYRPSTNQRFNLTIVREKICIEE